MTLEEIYASMGMKPPTLKGPIAGGAADRVAQIKAERAAGTRPTPPLGALDLTDTPGFSDAQSRVAQIQAEREAGIRNVTPGALDLTDTPGFAEAKAKVDALRPAYRERQANMGKAYGERLARDAAKEEEMSKIRAQKYTERLERNKARADAQGNAYMQLLKDRGYMNTGGLVDFAKGEALNYALPQNSFYGRLGSALGGAAGLFNEGGPVSFWSALTSGQLPQYLAGNVAGSAVDNIQDRNADLTKQAAAISPTPATAPLAAAPEAAPAPSASAELQKKLEAMSPEEFLAGQQARLESYQKPEKKAWYNFFNKGGHVNNINPLGPKDLLGMGKGKDVAKVKYKKAGGKVTDEVEVSYHNPYAAAGKSDSGG